MSIKQKTLALAVEHDIEVYIEPTYDRYNKSFQINLPKGFELPNGQTGRCGTLDFKLTHYQNWKALLEDVQYLIERKDSWRKIQEIA